jgi:hypothetical protein
MTPRREHLHEGQHFYEMVDMYRAEKRTSALTMYDIQEIIDKNTEYQIKPMHVLRYIVLGNACSWGSYETAFIHYDTYKRGTLQPHRRDKGKYDLARLLSGWLDLKVDTTPSNPEQLLLLYNYFDLIL